MLHPRPTLWFELVTTRRDLSLAMQALAASGSVELAAQPFEGARPVLPRLERFFDAFHALERDFGVWWPAGRGDAGVVLDNPIAVLEDTVGALDRWAEAARPLIERIQAASARRTELDLVARLLASLPAAMPLGRSSGGGAGRIARSAWLLPAALAEGFDTGAVVAEIYPSGDRSFVVAVGDGDAMQRLRADMAAHKATPVPLPEVLAETADRVGAVDRLRARAGAEIAAAGAGLDDLARARDLPEVLNRVAVLEWLYRNAGDVQATPHTVRITGWTSTPDGTPLRAALDAAGVSYVLSLREAEAGRDAPLVLDNPAWLRPFEVFTRLLGMPGRGAIDPSVMTAAIAPVLFGFMFGDVGQGAVLLLAGLAFWDRMPVLRLLVPGGAMAMVFGLLFGSVFSLEQVVPALWLHPLGEPVPVLIAALGLGVAILLAGIALDLVQAGRGGRAALWLRTNGGLVLSYAALLLAMRWPAAAWGLVAGLALTALGARDAAGRLGLAATGVALAEHAEGLMRLFVATVSFARVGAFALAHAGLSAAVVGVAEAAGGAGFWAVLLIGNLIVIALEGLVAGIQTTRLVLFEFFIRFFRAEGREFRPLAAPAPPRRANLNGGKAT